MLIAVLAGPDVKAELLAKGFHQDVEILWVDSLSSLLMVEADCYFDLRFEMDPERNRILSRLSKPLFIGAVHDTLEAIGNNRFIRINSWPGMIGRNLVELAFDQSQDTTVKNIVAKLGWEYVQVPDLPGFITARIVAAIVNEAYFALSEGVSTKQDIDLAMKAGTNYPFGPFEWAEKIGLLNILALLKYMHTQNSKYEPAPLLVNEIAAQL